MAFWFCYVAGVAIFFIVKLKIGQLNLHWPTQTPFSHSVINHTHGELHLELQYQCISAVCINAELQAFIKDTK